MVFRISLPRLVSLRFIPIPIRVHGIRGGTKFESDKDYENKKYNRFKKKRNIPKRYCLHISKNWRDWIAHIFVFLYGIVKSFCFLSFCPNIAQLVLMDASIHPRGIGKVWKDDPSFVLIFFLQDSICCFTFVRGIQSYRLEV